MRFALCRKMRFVAMAAAVIGLLRLAALLVVRHHSRPSGVELRVANLHLTTNSVLQATVILKNKTSRMLNVVDDSRGNPAFVMETTGTRVWLTDMVNSLKMNIAPGASLTNAVLLTNAPSRFRLKVTFRDLGAEKQDWSVYP